MIYTINKAILITEQIKKFTTGYTHHVVGHYSNIDFWIDEVVQTLNAINNYKKRFDKMYNAQKNWIEEHKTLVYDYCPICDGKCELSDGKPRLPDIKYQSELKESKKNLINSMYFFLVRCYNIGLLSYDSLKEKCQSIETSIDPNDLKKI